VRLEVGYEDADRQVFLRVRDLSLGGLYLLAVDPPQSGRSARVTLELPGAEQLLRIGATVVRADECTGFALRFDASPESDATLEQLRCFVAGRL
jgi:hypothetical protein